MMMGGQASLVLREAFAGWVQVLSQLKQERMREELLQLKLKCGESVRQKLGIMVGGQASLVLKSTVTGWRELVATLRQERIMEKLKEENLAYKAKSDESMRRAMSMMMGGQANMVLKSVVTGWCELLATLRQE